MYPYFNIGPMSDMLVGDIFVQTVDIKEEDR
jgi:hypothetical protein